MNKMSAFGFGFCVILVLNGIFRSVTVAVILLAVSVLVTAVALTMARRERRR